MLSFLRKHQKVFFIFTAIVVIISFSFFGTYSAIQETKKEKDTILGKDVDGSSISSLEMRKMCRLLGSDNQDSPIGGFVNIFNDGVIRKELLELGFGEKILNAFSKDIDPSLKERISRFKKYSSYKHPYSPILSTERVWEQFFPEIQKTFIAFKNEESFEKNVAQLMQLYQDQRKCPSELIRQMLWQMQHQMKLPNDPQIEQGDFAIFKAHSIQDWFGTPFLEACVQFIHNASQIALKRGCKVTAAEAKEDLFRIGYESLKFHKENLSVDELLAAFQNTLNALGLTEKDAISIWKKVLLFKKLLKNEEESAVLDNQTLRDSAEEECIEVDLYRLPKPLKFKSTSEKKQFDDYVNAISKKENPDQMHSLEEIEKTHPQFIQKEYRIEFSHASLEEAGMIISLKEMWDWQLKDENWQMIQNVFPEVKSIPSAEERWKVLDSLPFELKKKVDGYCREAIFKQNERLWISKVFENAPAKQETLFIPLEGKFAAIKGCENPQELISLLDSDIEDRLSFLTFDGKNYYQISVLERKGSSLIPFKEVQERNAASVENVESQPDASFFKEMQCMLQNLKDGREGSEKLLFGQLSLSKERIKVSRKDAHPFISQSAFDIPENGWSQVIISSTKEPYFFHVAKKGIDEAALRQKADKAHKALAKEAKKRLLDQILQEIQKKGGIYIEENLKSGLLPASAPQFVEDDAEI